MTIFTEIARFLLTAIAVALAVPTALAVISMVDIGSMSVEAYFGIAAICFFCAIFGGLVIGLPALWLAKHLRWEHSIVKMTMLGCLAGAAAGSLTMVPFFGDLSFSLAAMPAWSGFGAFAGLVAAPVWVLLHRSDATPGMQ